MIPLQQYITTMVPTPSKCPNNICKNKYLIELFNSIYIGILCIGYIFLSLSQYCKSYMPKLENEFTD